MLSDKREISTFLSLFLLIIIIFFRGSPSHGVTWWWPPVSVFSPGSWPWPPSCPCPWPWPWLLWCSAIFFLFYSLKKILAIVEFFKIEFLSDIFDWLFSYLLNSTSFLNSKVLPKITVPKSGSLVSIFLPSESAWLAFPILGEESLTVPLTDGKPEVLGSFFPMSSMLRWMGV